MASRLTEHKPLLWQLYIEKNFTAKQIAKYMQDKHQVNFSEGVYQRAFKTWGFKKYSHGSDWVWVDRKQRGRQELGKKTQFTFKNQIMDDAKIRKEISRNVSTVQQMMTVTTPKTPSDWAAMTPTASTPGYEPSDFHTLRGESPVEQDANADTLSAADSSNHGPVIDTNPERHDDIDAQIENLVQTMRECGAFIEMWARAHLTTNPDAMAFRYLDVARSIVLGQTGTPFVDSPEYASALHILRMTFFNDYSHLDQFFEGRQRMTDDILRTALFLTCKGSQYQAASVLLSHGAERNSKDTNGVPCLIIAARNNLHEMVKLLIDSGANVEAKDREGDTSWSHVCGLQSHDLVASVLEKAGAEKNVNRNDGTNPLYRASAGGHVDQVRVMLNRGMDPSFATPFRWQPLHWAANNGHLRIVKMLVEAGADLNPISDQSKTPLDMVSGKHNARGIRELLVDHGALKESQMGQKDVFDTYSFDSIPDSGFEPDISRGVASMDFTFSTWENTTPGTSATLTPHIYL